jgi:C-terminal processing protease CtpA/Prc
MTEDMTLRNKILLPLFLAVLASTMFSCGEDRWTEYAPLTNMDEWLDSVMRADYYFATSMPSNKKLNYFNAPSSFLSAAKVSEDKVSEIDSTANVTDSYGITALYEARSDTDSLYNAVVTYVDTDSPAAKAGLHRGDWIMKVGGKNIAKSNKSTILVSGASCSLDMGNYTRVISGTDTTYTVKSNGTTLSMSASTTVTDAPVHYYTTLTYGTKKVAYLVYSSFDAGTSDAYNNELRTAFASFKAAGATDMILDLRYNKGGSVDCAQLLASMLVPTASLGSTFVTLNHATEQSSKDATLSLDQSLIGSGANLNLSKIYILTTSTTRQMSELLIACLVPYMSVYTIGAATGGYVGVTDSYTNPAHHYTLKLLTSVGSNAAKATYTSSGIAASKTASDTSTLTTLLDFGNPKETMLAAALALIGE